MTFNLKCRFHRNYVFNKEISISVLFILTTLIQVAVLICGLKDGDCVPEWDGIICWPHSRADQLVSVLCPEYIYDFNHRGMSLSSDPRWAPHLLRVPAHVLTVPWPPGRAYRRCDAAGHWEQVLSVNRTWANYTECTTYLDSNYRSREVVPAPASLHVWFFKYCCPWNVSNICFSFARSLRDSISCTLSATPFLWHRCSWPSSSSATSSKQWKLPFKGVGQNLIKKTESKL